LDPIVGVDSLKKQIPAPCRESNSSFSVVQPSAVQTCFLAYHYHNTKHVRVPLCTASMNAYFQDTDLLTCFAGW